MSRRVLRNILGVIALPLLLCGSTSSPDTPVADAAQRRDITAVRQLLRQGADVNAAQGDGMTALHWAVQHGAIELGNTIISAGDYWVGYEDSINSFTSGLNASGEIVYF